MSSVSRALQLYSEGESDNEKLAALLIIAKILKSYDTDQPIRRKIFNGVGFEFINRLLHTTDSTSPHNDTVEPFHQVAVAILSSFCMDEELLLHPQVTSKIPQFNKFITSSLSSEGLLVDSLHCIHSLATVAKGRSHLWHHNTLISLVQCLMIHQSVFDTSRSIIIQMLSDTKDQISVKIMLESIEIISDHIVSLHTEFKFKLCQLLTDMLSTCGEYIEISSTDSDSNKWLTNVSTGLRDILQSKLDTTHRSIGLILVSCICQLLHGSQWCITSISPREGERLSSFLLLIVHLVGVELNMLIEDTTTSPTSTCITTSTGHLLLLSCFTIIEHTITLIANESQEKEEEEEEREEREKEREEDQNEEINYSPNESKEKEGIEGFKSSHLTDEDLLQLHSTLLDSLLNITRYIQLIIGAESNSLLVPAVRVLGAWLAEDSLSLLTEISLILPSLFDYCKQGEMGEEKENIVKFLLPGVGHFIEEGAELSRVLIKNGLTELLLKYTQYLIQRLTDVSVQAQLEMCLTVMLSICLKKEEKGGGEEIVWGDWVMLLEELIKNEHVLSHWSLVTHCLSVYMIIRRCVLSREGGCDQMDIGTDIIDVIMMSLINGLINITTGTYPNNHHLISLLLQELSVVIRGSVQVKSYISQSLSFSSLSQSLNSLTNKQQVKCGETLLCGYGKLLTLVEDK